MTEKQRALESPSVGGIYRSINAIMHEVGALGKDSKNEDQGWTYRSAEAVYNRTQPLFTKHGVFSVPRILNHQRERGETKRGASMFWSVMEIEYTFFHSDGSSIQCVVIGEGMDAGDKASSKAQTQAHKKAICQILNIPYAVDDPDSHTPSWAAKLNGRLAMDELTALKKKWLASYTGDKEDIEGTQTAFKDWAIKQCEKLEGYQEFDPLECRQWRREYYAACMSSLETVLEADKKAN